jgi:hypothetical protein
MEYDGSLHDFVELVTIFKTRPRSSKLESRCSSYDRFRLVVSACFRMAGSTAYCRGSTT